MIAMIFIFNPGNLVLGANKEIIRMTVEMPVVMNGTIGSERGTEVRADVPSSHGS